MPKIMANPPAMEEVGMMTNRPIKMKMIPTIPPKTEPALLGR